MSTHQSEFRETVLRASIPGAILPVVFYLLYSTNSNTTSRDILPDLGSPLATIGFLGLIATYFPGFMAFIIANSVLGTFQPVIAPYVLPSQALLVIQIVSSLGINTALWMLPVCIFRRIKQFFSISKDGDIS